MMSFMEKFIPIKFVVSLKTMILTLREKVSKLESVLGIQIIFYLTNITDRVAALTQEEFITKI